jgi:hypothetical protein
MPQSRANTREISKVNSLKIMNQRVLELLQEGIRTNQIKRSKGTFVFFTLDVFRNMVQLNYKNCLLAVFKKAIFKLALSKFKENRSLVQIRKHR